MFNLNSFRLDVRTQGWLGTGLAIGFSCLDTNYDSNGKRADGGND
jgi:hypothetical protein